MVMTTLMPFLGVDGLTPGVEHHGRCQMILVWIDRTEKTLRQTRLTNRQTKPPARELDRGVIYFWIGLWIVFRPVGVR